MARRSIAMVENADGSREAWADGWVWCGGTTCAYLDDGAPCEYHRRESGALRRLLGR